MRLSCGTGNWNLLATGFAATNLDLNGMTLTKTGTNTIGLVNTTTTAGSIQVSSGRLAFSTSGTVNASASSLNLANTSGVGLDVSVSSSLGSLSGGGTTGGNVAMSNNATLTVGALSTSTTYSGVISGAGAIAKNGSGTLTLSGANTYTGATTINAGTLRITSTGTSAITVNSGASLSGSSTGSTTQLLTMNAGSILSFDTNGAYASNGVTFAGLTTLGSSQALTSGTTYDVLRYGAGTVTGLSNLTGIRGTITNDTVNRKITLLFGGAGTRTWSTTTGTWDNLTTNSFAEGDFKFASRDIVIFNDPASASNVTLTGSLVPASVAVTNTNAYTFSGTGNLAGATSLTKSGTGTLTLSNTSANSYSGGTTINGGTRFVGNRRHRIKHLDRLQLLALELFP